MHIGVGSLDQLGQRHRVEVSIRSKLHMAHPLAGAFQHTSWIGNFGTSKESDIHMRLKRIDVGKSGIVNTGRWMTVVKEFTNVCSAPSHDVEPALRQLPQFGGLVLKPSINGGIANDGTVKSKKLGHIF